MVYRSQESGTAFVAGGFAGLTKKVTQVPGELDCVYDGGAAFLYWPDGPV